VCALLVLPGAALAQTEWTLYPDSPVLELGEPGSWDDAGHAAAAVYFDGSLYHLWYEGWDATGEHDDIGHATSPDGVIWAKDPANPVLERGATGEWDDRLVYGLGLVYDGSQFHMWYGGYGSQTGAYQGGYATSPDGTVWTKHPDNPVLTLGPAGSWDDSWVRPHTVILEGGTYRMWYEGWNGDIQHIGYAESTDGVTWTKRPEPVLEAGRAPGAWDSDETGTPYVVFDGATYHMWYYGWGGSGDPAIGYAFSDDGISWDKHASNPVLSSPAGVFGSPVSFDGATLHMWYTSIRPYRITYATSECCAGEPAVDRQTIPAAAYAAGAEGSFYETSLDLNNTGLVDADYRFLWLPRGASNTDPVSSELLTLGAGQTARYSNVLAEVFDLSPGAFGALAIESTRDGLIATARIANTPQEPDAGSFGQPLDAIRTADCTGQGVRRQLLFATEHDEMRFNVGCFNASDEPARVRFELYRSDGVTLGTESLDLEPWGNDQLNRILGPHQPVTGYVEYWSDLPTGSVYCYGSVLDNVTSDPTTVPPM
jgi:hypothetical protein